MQPWPSFPTLAVLTFEPPGTLKSVFGKKERENSESERRRERRLWVGNFSLSVSPGFLVVIRSLTAFSLTHMCHRNIYSTWRPDSLLKNENDWTSAHGQSGPHSWACLRVCVRVSVYTYVCLYMWLCTVFVHTSECVHFSMCRAIATLFFFKVILCSSQWRIFHSAANEIVLLRMGAYNCDEKNKQLVNENYDMFVYLIFWNCWIRLNNKWDFLSKPSQENYCIPKINEGNGLRRMSQCKQHQRFVFKPKHGF